MKQHIITGALLLALAACGAETEAPVDPYADLAEDSILVRFEANPEIEDGQCNPNVHYAMRTTEETIALAKSMNCSRQDYLEHMKREKRNLGRYRNKKLVLEEAFRLIKGG